MARLSMLLWCDGQELESIFKLGRSPNGHALPGYRYKAVVPVLEV